MIVYRNIISAFLEYDEKVLLMKRGLHKKIAPGKWSAIAGHIEAEEINKPYTACYREIKEETNLSKEHIEELYLKFIAFNKLPKEIVIDHMFFGKLKTDKVKANDEGELFWIAKSDIGNKMHIPGISKLINRYYQNPSKEIMLVDIFDEEPFFCWHSLGGFDNS